MNSCMKTPNRQPATAIMLPRVALRSSPVAPQTLGNPREMGGKCCLYLMLVCAGLLVAGSQTGEKIRVSRPEGE